MCYCYETAKYKMSAFYENLWKTSVVYISLEKKTITWTILFTKTILEIKEMKNNYMYIHTNNDETKGHGQVTIK